jgi:glycosyltransferase involved in cell wall biosynthesis
MNSPILTLAMIIKNEAATLEKCLTSAAPWVDKMVIVDTGSSDNSVEIARKFEAELLFFNWNDNFAEARNFGLDHADSDWFLILDADEELIVAPDREFRHLLMDPKIDAYFIRIFNLTSNGGYVSNRALRLFRNRPEYRFVYALHEQINCPSLHMAGKSIPIEYPLAIRHYGYLPELVRKNKKSERNLKIALHLAAEDSQNGFYQFNLGMEFLRLNQIEKAIDPLIAGYRLGSTGNQCTANSLNHALQALRLASRWNEWQVLWEEGIQHYPDYVDLWYEKAVYDLNLGNIDQSRNSIENCLRLGQSPVEYISDGGAGSWKAWGLLGELYLAVNDTMGAFNAFKASILINPHSAYLKSFSKSALQLFGVDRATTILPAMVNLEASVWLQITTTMILEGAGIAALKLFEKQQFPDSEEFKFITGLALLQTGNLAAGKIALAIDFKDATLRTESSAINKFLELIGKEMPLE